MDTQKGSEKSARYLRKRGSPLGGVRCLATAGLFSLPFLVTKKVGLSEESHYKRPCRKVGRAVKPPYTIQTISERTTKNVRCTKRIPSCDPLPDAE